MNYVLGFAFNEAKDNVVLIRKAKPNFQRGRINGIGGKIEHQHGAPELPMLAMSREFQEETGVDILATDWIKFGTIAGPCSNDRDAWKIHLFALFDDRVFDCGTNEQKGETVALYDPWRLPSNVMNNCRWLVPMALDQARERVFSETNYVN